jgi:GDP-L-fucose synthase
MIEKTDKIYLAGHSGLVGSNIHRALLDAGYSNVVTHEMDELDLTRQTEVEAYFQQERPDHVILAAAKVGGIHANSTYPAEFILVNLQIETNVFAAAQNNGVKRFLFLGSSCIYPKLAPQPMREEHLLTGELEPTNQPYAIAKIAGVEMTRSFHRQYGLDALALMPTNLYGPGDNFHPTNSHVLPSLMRRLHEARENGTETVTIWGTGSPRREFLFVEDLADAVLFLFEQESEVLDEHALDRLINVGVGKDISIRELAELIADVVGFEGKFEFDTTKPDGTPRKLMNVDRLINMGWKPKTELREGIERTYKWALDHGFDRGF